jgi:hypothetical protein
MKLRRKEPAVHFCVENRVDISADSIGGEGYSKEDEPWPPLLLHALAAIQP